MTLIKYKCFQSEVLTNLESQRGTELRHSVGAQPTQGRKDEGMKVVQNWAQIPVNKRELSFQNK